MRSDVRTSEEIALTEGQQVGLAARAHAGCVVCGSTNHWGLGLKFTVGKDGSVRARIERSHAALYILRAEVSQGGKVKATAVGKFMRRSASGSQ